MLPDDLDRLRHMRDAALWVERFVEGRSRLDVDQDVQLRFALAHAIQIIGEAASKVGAETREVLPNLPWAKIVGIRNRFVHAYFSIDHDILWNTATVSIPELLEQLKEADLS